MAIIKLGDLTTFTGDTSGSFLVINNSTNTATFKVQKEQLLSGSFAGTASFADNAATSSWAQNSVTASYVLQAVSASYALNSVSSSFASTASLARTASLSTTASYALTSSINQINQSQYRFELVTTIDQDLWLYPATITRVVKSPGVATAQYRTGSLENFNTITFTGNESTTPIAVKANDEFSWRITYNSGYTTAALTVVSQRS